LPQLGLPRLFMQFSRPLEVFLSFHIGTFAEMTQGCRKGHSEIGQAGAQVAAEARCWTAFSAAAAIRLPPLQEDGAPRYLQPLEPRASENVTDSVTKITSRFQFGLFVLADNSLNRSVASAIHFAEPPVLLAEADGNHITLCLTSLSGNVGGHRIGANWWRGLCR
jgi:hypothetical protein